MPGMPATGLGGIFYGLLILWILLREGWRTMRGRSLPGARRCAARLVAILLAILLAFYLCSLAIESLQPMMRDLGRDPALSRAYQSLLPRLALVPIAILMLLMIGLQLLRLVLARRGQTAAGADRRADREPLDLSRTVEEGR
jgi:hypothetical protein